MSYTNNDFTKYDDAKCLPENILLLLLNQSDLASHEVDVFRFLVKWYDYQTKELKISLNLVPQLFQSVEYALIIPQLLSSEVAKCDLVDKPTLSNAFEYLFGSSKPIGQFDQNLSDGFQYYYRRPCFMTPHWNGKQGVEISHLAAGKCTVHFEYQNLGSLSVVQSLPLGNGIYSFSFQSFEQYESKAKATSSSSVVHSNPPPAQESNLNIAISSKEGEIVYTSSLENGDVFSLYTHDKYLFLKCIENDEVKSTISTRGSWPFRIWIRLQKAKKRCVEYVVFNLVGQMGL